MFPILGRRGFCIILLVISSLWVSDVFLPILYAVAFPAADFREIVQALELRGTSPPEATIAVQRVIAAAGPLRRAALVSTYSKVGVTLQLGAKHQTKRTQEGYIAWFENRHKPILLLIEHTQIDNSVKTYEIGEGEPTSVIRALGFPLLALAISAYMVRRKKPIAVISPTI
ncbi:MAG: hypothetical protein LAO08_17215 [Acidobacteriia bacterium]|nr:hypothetical protein [Terriglobia bacterium]